MTSPFLYIGPGMSAGAIVLILLIGALVLFSLGYIVYLRIKRMGKKKKNLMNPDRKTFSTSTPTSTESSPGGGGPPGSPSGGGAY